MIAAAVMAGLIAGAPLGASGLSETCLAKTLCAIKDRVRWRQPPWSPDLCARLARVSIEEAKRSSISVAIAWAVVVNESDLTADAMREYHKDGRLFAADAGLGGIRCVFDQWELQRGRRVCANRGVRGVAWEEILDSEANLRLVFAYLAYFKDGGGVELNRHGRRMTFAACRHLDHAWWAHYNHGPRYIGQGPARHYPHRIAVIALALSRALGVEAPPELQGPISVVLHREKPRRPDRPVGTRQKRLVSQILAVTGTCRPIAIR